jgi:hypothetical protein
MTYRRRHRNPVGEEIFGLDTTRRLEIYSNTAWFLLQLCHLRLRTFPQLHLLRD